MLELIVFCGGGDEVGAGAGEEPDQLIPGRHILLLLLLLMVGVVMVVGRFPLGG